MVRLRPYPVAVLAGLTLLIWTTRLPLAWTNPDDELATKVIWTLPITAFWVSAAIIAFLMLTDRHRYVEWFRPLAQTFAIGTIAYWAIRYPILATADHNVPFKVVHGVLAAVSIGAGVWALLALRTEASALRRIGSGALP